MIRKLLLGAILACGVGYLLAMAADHTVLRWILKPGTIVLILLYATAARQAGAYPLLVRIGLLISAVGDCFLLAKGGNSFTYGVLAFMAAHLAYIAAFVKRRQFAPKHFVVLAIIIGYSAFLLSRLHGGMAASGSESMFVPITVYVAVISVMIWCAAGSRNKWALTGAILFYVSDSLLAWNKFIAEIPFADYGVMVTYYLAQFLIAASIGGGLPARPPAYRYAQTGR